ncbi:unannotated protein [freshwater metagenome]|uniref:Unannotated protein n=1 Tax=freshwater metagenome TaxID=449393 RepID=A0A6J6TRZ3_9ZZZZ
MIYFDSIANEHRFTILSFSGHQDGYDRRAHRHNFTFMNMKGFDRSGIRAWEFDNRFGGLNLYDDLIDRDTIAGAHPPLDDFGFCQTLTYIG